MKSTSSKKWIDLYRQNPEHAWEIFLQLYNQLIMAVIRKLVQEHDDVMELYTHTVEKLREKDCKKLTSYFSKPRKYSFETWIAVVVRNCALDWFRKEEGRQRLLKCIKALPPLDQWIFRYICWQRHSYEVTYELLRTKHGFNLSFEEMCSHCDQINETLHQKTRYRIQEGWQAILAPFPLEAAEPSQQTLTSPEEELILKDSERMLKEALHTLSHEQQLIVQLHFYRGLTLEEIARILNMKNLWRVHRKLKKALKSLKKKLTENGIGPSDLEIS